MKHTKSFGFAKKALALLALSLGSLTMSNTALAAPAADLTWTSSTQAPLQIHGLPYLAENEGNWWRFPKAREHDIPDYVWNTSTQSSGARLRFRTDATELSMRGVATRGESITDNLSRISQGAFDLYIDGQYCRSILPAENGAFEETLLSGVPAGEREICIYAPLFAQARIDSIGVNAGARLAEAAPYALPKPVVFYGTSITHGGCAARAALSYPAQTARRLGLDYVNFGLNGCGRGEVAVGQILAGVDAAAFVLHYSQNHTSTEAFEAAYGPFLDELRAGHPTTPIVCITPIYWTGELPGSGTSTVFEANREVVRRAVAARRAAGDANIHVIEGFDLLGPEQGDGLIDGLHPNTLGYEWIAEALAPRLKLILGL